MNVKSKQPGPKAAAELFGDTWIAPLAGGSILGRWFVWWGLGCLWVQAALCCLHFISSLTSLHATGVISHI